MSRAALAASAAALALTAVLAVTAAMIVLRGGGEDRFAQCREGQIAGGDIGGPFTLVNGDGETVTQDEVITKPALIYFGYTFCPDVCPLDNARNAEAARLLQERGIDVRPVFISVDPERDTPQVVGEFAENFHDDMVGLTGSPEQVRAASQAYKTYYKAHDGGDEYYLVDHSTFTYLALPGEGVVDFIRRDTAPEAVAERVACFSEAA